MPKRTPWVTTAEPKTKYTPEILGSLCDYLDIYETLGDVVPTAAAMAVYANVSISSLYKWDKDTNKPEISEIIAKLKAKQEAALINKGLVGKFNSTITKLILTKHGYSDKQDNSFTGAFTVNISDKDAGTL